MKIIDVPGWKYYIDEATYCTLDMNKVGKWMFFYKNGDSRKFAEERCREAVGQGIICEAKVSDNPTEGVSCFYLNCDDFATHRKIIQYFLDNDMISRTKAGRLYNIPFKLDRQTRAGEYGTDFKATLKLDEFIDLNSGRWIQ